MIETTYDELQAIARVIARELPTAVVSVEYPGWIAVQLARGCSWNIGTSNGPWGADYSKFTETDTRVTFETCIHGTVTDPELVGRVLAHFITITKTERS